MKNKFLQFIMLLSITLLIFSCKENKQKNSQVSEKPVVETPVAKKASEFDLLVNYLEKNGDYINSEFCPAMIDAKNVHKNLKDKSFLVIDIRKPEHYAQGHIPSAKNVKYYDIVNYFENSINPADYNKIVLVCYSGQSASYLTSLLNMMGYDNVYAMKFGMSSWDKADAKNFWLKNISDKYVDKLETKDNPKNSPGAYPSIYTGETEAAKILRKQADNILQDPFKARLVSADEVYNHPEKFYVINYWPKEKYLAGHLPGAIQYTPKKSLSTDTYLNTLPTDKPIVVYCYTGQHAAMVAAYLNLLGYDARVLKYGANSFMHSKLVKNKWHPFTPKKIYNFPLEKALQGA